jgi:hypothetical protein
MLNSNKEHAYSRTSTLTFAVLFSVAGLGQSVAQAQGISAGSFDEVFANPRRVDPTFMRPEVMKSLPLLSAISPDESAPELGSAVPTFTRTEVMTSLSSLPLISPAESAPEPGRVAPTFIRPQVISGLPPLPISPDESTSEPVATASTNPPEALEARDQPGRVTPSFTRPEVMKSLASALEKLVISPAEAETSLAPPPSDAPQPSELRGAAAKVPPNQPTVTWRLPVARLITNSHLNRAAHKTLPLGTWVRVVNKKNNRSLIVRIKEQPLRVRVVNKKKDRSMIVRINDRTPAKAKGVVDLSRGSARALGITGGGPVALQKAQ